jgi:lysophospholipid acyltransferase (LPLAT)-like uncharacterized protein
MLKRLFKQPTLRTVMAHLLGRYLQFALRTTRWTLHGEAHVGAYFAGRPCIAAFWHERLPLMPALWLMAKQHRPANRMHVLISRHRDGRLIAKILRRFGAEPIHASSSRGGASGARALLDLLEHGAMVAVTPDGPRGPRRTAAPGVAHIAALAEVEILPCSGQTTHRWTLGSWDRMVVPLPFGRGVLVCAQPIAVPRETWRDCVPMIVQSLNQVADTADILCARSA